MALVLSVPCCAFINTQRKRTVLPKCRLVEKLIDLLRTLRKGEGYTVNSAEIRLTKRCLWTRFYKPVYPGARPFVIQLIH